MSTLKDPRAYVPQGPDDPCVALAGEVVRAGMSRRPACALRLRAAIATLLEDGKARVLEQAFARVPDAAHYRVLREALEAAVVHTAPAPGVVAARAFAIPLVLVAAATARTPVGGAMPDVAALQGLLEQRHVLGPVRNFGLSNALCSLEALEALDACAVHAALRALQPQALHAALPPAALTIVPGREQVELRFLAGAAVTAADAPGFVETAANIGAWGRDFAQAVQRQLATPGLQLLVLPRPPRDLLAAAHAGRLAQLEIALDLFVSNTLRRFRSVVGDPLAIVSTHAGAELRVTLSSPFAEDLTEGYRWPLSPLDDLAYIEAHVLELLRDVRLHDVRVVPEVLPSARTDGSVLFPGGPDWDELSGRRARH